ncbi:element excision factor XisI family protein [Tychonema bourrellyi]|uniref:element excision factor XisI family protein n=1 Tax=Tychonema bourrellyi TaxID=54313 RepID=UPI0026BB45C9
MGRQSSVCGLTHPTNYCRSDYCIIYIEIKDGKIWIERDGTEIGVANELLEAGVPKTDIVLAFYAPYRRPYTEFAVG